MLGVMVILLDGPVGTELARRGVPTPLPLWSAGAIRGAPAVLAAIHRDYAAAGATVHTANTFLTSPSALPMDARALTHAAVAIARGAVPSNHRVAGSIAPVRDCYRPDLSPPAAEADRAHRAMAELLAEAGVDLIVCETFPHPDEAVIAVRAAVATGLPTWLALTAGPFGDLLDDAALLAGAAAAVDAGATAVLVNCVRPARITRLIPALAGLGVPTGGYGNVGRPCATHGWITDGDGDPAPYAEQARGWIASGATIVGGCCGTTPAHIAALAAATASIAPV